MNISRGKQQELKEIEGTIDDIKEQVERLSRLVAAQPDLNLVSGSYDMKTDIGILYKALGQLRGTLYYFALDFDLLGWKNIK